MRWPVGTAAENEAARGELPGSWFSANPFLNWYEISPGTFNWHDGVDLNLNAPTWNADYHSPLYSPAAGVVTFAGVGGGSWGHLINVRHYLPSGTPYITSYGHIEKPLVRAGEVVAEGQQIAAVGNGDGWYVGHEHLHFRICTTDLLLRLPTQWSGTNKVLLLANFVDPVTFIRKHFMTTTTDQIKALLAQALALVDTLAPPITPPDPPGPVDVPTVATVTTDGLNMRNGPGTGYAKVGFLDRGAAVTVIDAGAGDGHAWAKIVAGNFNGSYVAKNYLSF